MQAITKLKTRLSRTSHSDSTKSADSLTTQPHQQPNWFKRHPKATWTLLIGSLVSVLLLSMASIIGWHTYTVAHQIQAQAGEIQTSARAAYDAFKAQDLLTAQAKLSLLPDQLANLKSEYKKLGYLRMIPVVNSYYKDGEQVFVAAESGISAAQTAVEAVAPYADILGFAGEGTFTGGSAENRIKLILETLDKVMPQLDSIATDLTTAGEAMAKIDANRYPEEFRGRPIRNYITQGQGLVEGAATAITDYRPVIEQLSSIAGGKGERKKYLILFQNDNELRPTGGFLTAYATIFVENGVVSPEKSDDIYELDKKYANKDPIPPELGRYLTTERLWNIRDKNTDPDFANSMEQFLEAYGQVRGEPKDIDGIIAIDTEFVTGLLNVLGPVNVEGYGTFSTENDARCDCPQIIYALSEIITRPTPYLREDRKGILGPLMRSMLTKAYDAPRDQWPPLFTAFGNLMAERHLQFYFLDENAQKAAETLKAAGRMVPPSDGSDFLAVINANLGGAKSNLFVTSEIVNQVQPPTNGRIQKTVEIIYKNPRRADNCNLEAGLLCLNSTLRDWTRIYLPEGSELTEATGFTQEAKTYDENGFTVVDGFFILEPLGTSKIRLIYTVPYTDEAQYRVELFKQGGVTEVPVLMDVNGNQEELVMKKDLKFQTEW